MKLELNDQQFDLIRDTLDAALSDLNQQIESEGLPDRRALRDRRIMLRALCEALPAQIVSR